jgi:PKD repeat protein
MKNRFLIVVALIVILAAITGSAQAMPPDMTALVYVNIGSADDLDRFASTQLPLYTMLDGGLLSGANQAGQQSLEKAGLTLQVLDPDLLSGDYYLAETRPSRQAPDFNLFGQVLLNTTNGALLRMDPAQVASLTQAGAELRLITLTPKPIPSAQAEALYPDVVEPDPLIQLMMDQVTTDTVYEYDEGLAGERQVWVDGAWYTITSRHTDSGTNIQKATSYVGQHMADLGLDVEYHQWDNPTNPNVIGELPGLVNPEDIFIIGGHLDDVQFVPGGADDNASGSVAAMIAADILTQYQWGCTLRFAFWTGEEQGLIGSGYYAQRSYQQGENILGYLNLDMIAWNTIGSQPSIYLGYGASVPASHDLALLFADVLDAYNINLLPVIGTGYSGSSDHGSFLQFGYPAILGIEGDDDFNPYYHSPQDITANTDPVYFTDYVRASVGTFAHMTGCLIPNGVGALDGHVTNASGGSPIPDVTITADDGQGHSFTANTDPSGYYTQTLLAGIYDVNATVYGFQPSTVTGVEIITGTVTTEDFALTAVPTYTVSGYVTDLGTGDPLAAQVEFLDAPVAPVNTDPATGFYSIEVAEGTWTMKATADQHASQTVTVNVSGDTSQNFALSPFCDVLADDVENGNIGWTAQSPWAITTEASHSPTHSWTDSPGGSYQNFVNTSLTSPVVDLTDYAGMKLNFWHTYATESGYDYASVEYSTNGGSSWTPVESYDGSSPAWTQEELLIPQLDGQANAKIRFHFTTDSSVTYDGWHVDDIALVGGGSGCVEDTPIEGLTATSTSPDALGEPTTLTASVTGGTNIVYTWDFGDGDTGDGAITDHVYPAVGTYEATVIAANSTYSDTATTTVVIEEGVTGLIATNDSPTPVGSVTTFTASVTGGLNVSYTWDFGDGATGSGQVVTHMYDAPGSYTAMVTATNPVSSAEAETVAEVVGSLRFYLPFVTR